MTLRPGRYPASRRFAGLFSAAQISGSTHHLELEGRRTGRNYETTGASREEAPGL